MARRLKNVHINQKEYDSETFCLRFERIRQGLVHVMNDSSLTTSALARIAGSLILFQDDQFGRNATGAHARKYTKIPHKLFQDYSDNGALYVILYNTLRFKEENGWRKLELSVATKLDKNLELFDRIYKALLDAKLLKFPNVFIANSLPNKAKLAEIAQRHSATVTEVEAAATHIVLPDPNPPSSKDTSTDYCRTVERRDRSVLVHWWYYPDSYDSWLPASQIEGEAEIVPPKSPIAVTDRWVLDLEYFNEYPNEEDYEPEDLSQASQQQKRRKNTVDTTFPAEEVPGSAPSPASAATTPGSDDDLSGRRRKAKRNYSELSDDEDFDFDEPAKKRRKATPKRDLSKEVSRLPRAGGALSFTQYTGPVSPPKVRDQTGREQNYNALANPRKGQGKGATRDLVRESVKPQTLINLSNNFGVVITTSNVRDLFREL